jgi:hypothetical protein
VDKKTWVDFKFIPVFDLSVGPSFFFSKPVNQKFIPFLIHDLLNSALRRMKLMPDFGINHEMIQTQHNEKRRGQAPLSFGIVVQKYPT